MREATPLLATLIGFRVAIEILASFYAFSLILKSILYVVHRPRARTTPPASTTSCPPVAVVYLSAGDLDQEALRSLCDLSYAGPLAIFVHDDSGDPRIAESVDRAVADLRTETGRRVTILRRPRRTGGKPGAVNYVLGEIGRDHPFFLLCDNDSIAIDRDAIERGLPYFSDPMVGAVQFRNVGVAGPSEGFVNRMLTSAIEVFDLFAVHQARYGLLPFLGHNGMLRTSAVLEVGSMTEGCFADDIDLSVRLALSGRHVRYAPDIRFGERHPATYESFRRRAFKWAFGCGQVLRRHLRGVIASPVLTAGQKLGFVEFTSFYAAQCALLAYLVLAWIVFPWFVPAEDTPWTSDLTSSGFIAAAVFLPSLSYFAKQRRLRSWWPFAWVCALVYGSVAFVTVRGVLAGLWDRPRPWVPTNSAPVRSHDWFALATESLFGLAIFLVPTALWQGASLEPALYLFVSVFLFAPLIALTYTQAKPVPATVGAAPRGTTTRPRSRLGRFFGLGLCLALLSTLAGSETPLQPHVETRDGAFWVEGQRFLVKGIHYSPWPPGTGPMKNHVWPADALVTSDLQKIQDLGANTILIHDAPARLLDQASERGLEVIYTFFLNWQSIADDAIFEKRFAEIATAVRELAPRRNLLAILLGNEVVEWVYQQKGDLVQRRLRSLRDVVKSIAPEVPVSHANWPLTKGLDLSFMDFTAFNLYPTWPRDVVMQGYGNYIQNTLIPLAKGKPLVITEFGQNALEANEERQAQVLRESWSEIERRTAGGVVFEYADEWWKNYDNPIREGDWWNREHAPDDETKHDLDPEEYYGIFTAERVARPASAAVREMFRPPQARVTRAWVIALPLGLIALYTIYVLRRRPPARDGASGTDGSRAPAPVVNGNGNHPVHPVVPLAPQSPSTSIQDRG